MADTTDPSSGLAELIADLDWSTTPIGPSAAWPQSLRTAVGICLESKFPILIWWGPELVMLYNDAYRLILGESKHPLALGMAGADVWPEIWNIIGPMLHGVLERGEATWSDDQLLLLDRNGYLEECYFTFSYSPIRDESGEVAGVFTAVHETTDRVLDARRLHLLRRIGAETAAAPSDLAACVAATDAMRGHPDTPEVTIWLADGDSPVASASTGPEIVPLDEDEGVVVLALEQAALPPFGSIAVRLNRHRARDSGYVAFLELLAASVGAAIADARADELQRRRAEGLAELDRAKTTFFGNVSHELRTPLTLILGPLEQLISRLPDGEDRESLTIVHRNALRLLRLVNTLLDFSRVEAGALRLAQRPIDLAAATADVAASFRSAVETAGLRFEVDAPSLDEDAAVDPEAWEKIVLNLVSNALKFTFEGVISVSLREEDGDAVLRVSDTGTGIPEDELPRLFERFHRVRGAAARTHEGSGIGLALVRELVELHGGRVEAESEVGRGSTFTVRVPLRAEVPVDTRATSAVSATSATAFVEEALRWVPESSDPPAVARPDAPRVVVADDNADMLAYMRRLLEEEYNVETCGDGRAALERIREAPPAVVVADVMMPRLTGLELLTAIRGDDRLRQVPVILVSARAGEGSTVEGLTLGADDYLVKPFAAQELLARVRSTLTLARVREEMGRLLALEEVRSHVVTTVSHELRTPVASIYGAVKTLSRADGVDDGMRDRLLGMIEQQAERLSRLVGDVLSAGSLASGSLQVSVERVAMSDLLRSVAAEWTMRAPSRQVLVAEVAPALAVRADAGRLRQVLHNLIENATKYAPGAPVAVDVGQTGDRVRIVVSDEGPGVPADQRERIFERFYRLDPELRDGVGGTGLGLYITRALVGAMDGRIWFEPNDRGGSRFVVELAAA